MPRPRRKCRRQRLARRHAYLPPCQESGTAGLFRAMRELSGGARRPAMEDVMDKPTTSPISTRKHGDVLIVLSNNPPVNALSTAVRKGLVDAIAEAEGDDSVNAVVIACEGQTFFAGADITEFGKPPQMPWLPEVVDRIENCSKPVVAAIHGTALGGGLEVALGCHY